MMRYKINYDSFDKLTCACVIVDCLSTLLISLGPFGWGG